MSTICQPLPQFVVEDILQIAARAICDRPGDTALQRASRTRQMVYSILGFEPRDGLEYMLATMVVGHFHLILDSMQAVFRGQMDSVKAKTKTGVVSLDRAMLGFVRELRLIRHRPLAGWAEEAQRQSETANGPPQTPEWIAPWAGVRPEPPTASAPVADPPAAEPTAPTVSVPIPSRTPDPVRSANRPVPPPPDPEDAATARHIAEFEEALAALTSSLEEARALDGTRTEAKVAGGD